VIADRWRISQLRDASEAGIGGQQLAPVGDSGAVFGAGDSNDSKPVALQDEP
jgi:hypothetical protein